MSLKDRNLPVLLLLMVIAVGLAATSPPERVLGTSARIVYLHGALVWAALLVLALAAATGALALIDPMQGFHRWSAGLGRSGTLFWLGSLALSLWAMQAGWNGLFLEEPRWRLGAEFGLAAILLQVAVPLVDRPRVTGLLNFGFFIALIVALASADSIMHPSSPILTSGSVRLQANFLANVIVLGAAGVVIAHRLRFSS